MPAVSHEDDVSMGIWQSLSSRSDNEFGKADFQPLRISRSWSSWQMAARDAVWSVMPNGRSRSSLDLSHISRSVNKFLECLALDDDCAVASDPDAVDVNGHTVVNGWATSIAAEDLARELLVEPTQGKLSIHLL